MRQLKVLIADDHRLMLQAIRLALAESEDIEIVAEADCGTKVLPLVGQTDPDIVLLDVRMPGIDGLTVLERLRERYPKVRVAMLSAVDDPAVVKAALNRGASAFIVKHIDPRDLAAAVRQAIEGAVFQPLGLLDNGNSALDDCDLSKRELTILQALQCGLPNKQIAKDLFLAEQTVKFHLTNIYRKLGVNSRTEAVRYAYEHGLVENPLFSVA
jgi:NarL family two-component system response regulator YdfI